jgi:hypothetical protein
VFDGRIMNALVDALRANVASFYKVSESMAFLDMFAAFAKHALDAKTGTISSPY